MCAFIGRSHFAWTQWEEQHIWWTLILALSQVAQIVRTYLPYSRRLDALKYLIPDMQKLIIDVENKWYELECLDDPDYIPVVYDYRQRLIDLENKYLGADPLPDIPCLRSKADKTNKTHFALYTEIMEGGEEDAPDPRNENEPNAD